MEHLTTSHPTPCECGTRRVRHGALILCPHCDQPCDRGARDKCDRCRRIAVKR